MSPGLIDIIQSSDPAVRDRPLESVCQDADLDELLKMIADGPRAKR